MSASQRSIDDYKQIITNYSLDNCKHGNQGYQRLLLQLFGLPGTGKSSFINSCKFVFDGIYGEHAKVAGEIESHGSCTTRKNTYKLTDVITMVDNHPFPTLRNCMIAEMYAQLGNLLPLDEEVEWVTDYERNVERLMEEDKKANYTDFIVPIFVHRLKFGINPLVLLTHKCQGGLTAQEAAFKDMGADQIYSIENYTKENHLKIVGKHEEILKLLCQVLKEVDFCMENERDPKSERNDRMGIVLRYMKKVDDQEREAPRRERIEAASREQKDLCSSS